MSCYPSCYPVDVLLPCYPLLLVGCPITPITSLDVLLPGMLPGFVTLCCYPTLIPSQTGSQTGTPTFLSDLFDLTPLISMSVSVQILLPIQRILPVSHSESQS